jgi:predicted transcriptional regulator
MTIRMNKFNEVFLAVKSCLTENEKHESECFSSVAERANVPIEKLEFYLSTLQDLGLIKYSTKDRTIKLTSFGKKQDRLFA